MSQNAWADNLDDEVSFWERWLTEDVFLEERQARLNPDRQFPKIFLDLIEPKLGESLRAIDIGSGPISTLGSRAAGHPFELVCADALAESYNHLLDRLGFVELPRVQNVKGENLVTTFGRDAFNIVHCANALDHFEDPARAFRNMFEVCRPGGAIILISVENEGERERYHGLHQWNLRADDKGIWLWNTELNVNLLSKISGWRDYAWRYVHTDAAMRIFRAVIRRHSLIA